MAQLSSMVGLMAKVNLRSQIDAVELMLVNRRGHIANLERLVELKRRDSLELQIAKYPVEALEAAINTLKWLEKNEQRIKSALSAKT